MTSTPQGTPHGTPDGVSHGAVPTDITPPSVAATPRHEPVMLREALEGLDVRPGGTYVDATAGLGGHSFAIAQAAIVLMNA